MWITYDLADRKRRDKIMEGRYKILFRSLLVLSLTNHR
jgi:hypothetical protein